MLLVQSYLGLKRVPELNICHLPLCELAQGQLQGTLGSFLNTSVFWPRRSKTHFPWYFDNHIFSTPLPKIYLILRIFFHVFQILILAHSPASLSFFFMHILKPSH